MPTDRVSTVHTPRFLQSVSLGFTMRGLAADRLSPRIPVNNQSDKYRKWGRNRFMLHETTWAPGTEPNQITMRWSEDTYYAPERKIRTPITDSERANSDDDLDLETQGTELVTGVLAIAREKRVADLFTNPANYAAAQKITKAGGSEWDQAAVVSTAQPLIDLMSLVQKVAINAMVPASELTVAIPEPVYLTALWQNAGILDRIKYSERGVVTTDLLAGLLGVKEVIMVSSMSTGSGPEVADSDVVTAFPATYLWGDTVWVGLVAEGRNQMTPSFSRSFNWKKVTGGQERQVRKYRAGDEGKETDLIEAKEAVGEKIVFADAGGIIINTLSTI